MGSFAKRLVGQFVACAALGLAAASASGQAVISFSYNNLSSAYNTTSHTFTALARANDPRTYGGVSRIGPTASGGGDAIFAPGFYGSSVNADFFLSMVLTGTSATGTYVITADNNDDLRGNITGTWAPAGTASVFTGTLTGLFSDPGMPFTGYTPTATNFFTQIPGTMNGAISIVVDSGNFFATAYNFTPSQAQGMFPVPAPGSLALLGLAGLVACRRRRR